MSRVQKNEKENDQAGELRSRIERQKAKSSLPKRSKVHQNKKKKSKVKIKFPMIQLLALFFILLPIGFYTLYTYLQDRPVPYTKSDQVVFKDDESIPTTATADDLKEKESAKAGAEKEKEEAEAKAEQEAEEKAKAEQEAEEKAKAEQEAEEKAKAEQEAEEKAKTEQEAEEKAKTEQEAEEKAKAQQIADKKAKKAAAEKKKAAENVQAAKPDKEGYKVVLHTVQGEETLFRISMNYYKSQEGIALIREWNGLSGNEISKGQVLKIPIKK
ncbi:LysM peptidoglycan-binding domain-containing protein [Peribacillus sp. V2I11]|uniref:LysM peptidoglycan-binding domain-containing protein n=1 Tax=Peribacillus sp. V2I11 TaxID=3042277 RepID=UPI002785BF24|nr:LysM peptidoglycan-binding domain-containing protein [Peribacillus sp. V2I11]MDQ0883343.1 Tfp pilus assembly protein FimV [Peribacillus sp. V2I11]